MCFLEKVREKFDLHIEINGMVRGVGPGGPGGPGPPLESRIYSVKILKIGKISFSLLVGPPLGKIRSLAPVHISLF